VDSFTPSIVERSGLTRWAAARTLSDEQHHSIRGV
jgi:hypothetical protein